MKEKELRIGNCVNSNPFNGIITVFHNEKCVVKHKSGIVKCLIDDLQPIPLTEEWLLKCGFKTGFSDLQFMIRVTKDCSIAIWINNHNDNCMIGDELELTIKYLHQLQNLYFALTGEELNIEL